MNNYILVTLDIKNEGIPKIISQYLLKSSEWEPIKKNLDDDFEFILHDEDLFEDKIIINRTTLGIQENTSSKHIEAFKILYKNSFFNYDVLSFIKSEIEKPKKVETVFQMDNEDETDADVGYYINTKKSTPEFSNLDDEMIRKLVLETKKTVKMFKKD